LYAALQELNKPDKKIITAEDPVEYSFDGMNQCQVKEEIELTFDRILRAMLRQAPNIILVGEIRDGVVADIAIQAALTGHLVFSTLHTNDAPSAITRLIDMGVKPFLVASSIQAIMAQRLVRVICKKCKVVDENPNLQLLRSLGISPEYVEDHPEIDPKRIGLLGHSEGSIIASLAAAQSKDIAFIVMLAGPGLPGEEYNYQFEESVGRVLGRSEEAIALIRATQERIFAVLKEEKDTAVARTKLRQILENLQPPMPEPEIQANLRRYLSPWFLYSITYDPASTLKRVKCPVLAIFGEKDVHVPPEGNLEGVEKVLKESGNPDYRVELLPGLNHLFQTAETGAPSEYARIEETIAPKALELIAAWILEHTIK